MAQVIYDAALVVRRLLRMEHGVRKCARIFLFMDRRQALSILIDLDEPVLIAILREMAKLKRQVQDMHREYAAVREQLGELAQVIELRPPDPRGARRYAFLELAEPTALREVARGLEHEQLAALICNAPLSAAIRLFATTRSKDMREALVAAMSRLQVRNAEDDEAFAARVRKQLAKAGTQRGKRLHAGARAEQSHKAGGMASQHSGAVAFGSAQGDADPLVALVRLAHDGGERELQRALGAVADDLIALAVAAASAEFQAQIRARVSPRRWQDVMAAAEAAGEKSSEQSGEAMDTAQTAAAQRALLRRLRALI